MDVIAMNDGEIHNIGNDSDFFWLLQQYMGYDVAEWYEARIKRVDKAIDEIREIFKPVEGDLKKIDSKGDTYYDLTECKRLAEIGKLSMDDLCEIAALAWELPRWDE